MKNKRELMARKADLVKRAKEIEQTAEMTAELRTEFDGVMAEINEVNGDMERVEKMESRGLDLASGQAGDATIGMPQKDVRKYSIIKAIRASVAAMRGDFKAWDQAGLEAEASRAVAQQLGREAKGFFVPEDVLLRAFDSRSLQHIARREMRDLQKAQNQYGGYLVQTEYMSFIDLLRARLVLEQAGVTVLNGLVGDVAMPKQTAGATGYWVAEGQDVSESTQTFGQVSMHPRTVGSYTEITRTLLLQSSVDVEALMMNDLAAAVARAVDYAGLHGTGASNSPLGVQNITGIGSVSFSGGPTLAKMIDLETEVATDNADLGRLAYITNVKVRGKAKQTAAWSNSSLPVWAPDNTVNGYPAFATTQVLSTISTNKSACFFGNWADMLIGMWGALDVLVNPYANDKNGTVRVRVLKDVDIAVRHAESFAAAVDIVA